MIFPPGEIKKIAVLRALYLGDLLCAIPAIRALRMAYPEAEIVLLGLPWARSFVQRFSHYIDRLIVFPGYPGLPEQIPDIRKVFSFLKEIQEERFDLILQMQGNGTVVNDLLESFGATYYAGFYHVQPPAYNHSFFIKYPDNVPEIMRHLRLMEALYISWANTFLEFPINTSDVRELDSMGLNLPPRYYAVIHPGSRSPDRRWHPKYFASLADRCAEQGLAVLISGVPEEKPIADEVLKYMKYTAINIAGSTSLGAMGLLIKNAFLLVTNCTGVSHIAAAVKTPSIVISMDGEADRWAPLDKSLHHVLDWKKRPRFPEVFQYLDAFLENNFRRDKIKRSYDY